MTAIEIITLPVARWHAYRELRLEALADAPQAFGATYAGDAAHPPELWQQRLQDNLDSRSLALFAAARENLVGMIGAFYPDGPELAQVVAVYVKPAYRGRGAGRLLVAAMLERLRENPATRRARLTVNVEQVHAVQLYVNAGFIEVARVRERMGDGELYDELILERPLP